MAAMSATAGANWDESQEEKIYDWAEETFECFGINRDVLGVAVRVLSLDGGGVKGIVECLVLEKLESGTKRLMWQQFDLIVGTSTGAIIALGCARQKLTATELVNTYTSLAKQIFQNYSYWGVLKNGYLYDVTALENALIEYFDKVAKSPYTKCCVTACDATDGAVENREFLFKFYDPLSKDSCAIANVRCWHAARASSAAPSYFPPFVLPVAEKGLTNSPVIRHVVLVDGGVLNNNPAEVALQEARSVWPLRPVECLISLSCGKSPCPIARNSCDGMELPAWLVDGKGRFVQAQDLLDHQSGVFKHVRTTGSRVLRFVAPVDPVDARLRDAIAAGHRDGVKRHAYTRVSPSIDNIAEIGLSDASKVPDLSKRTTAWLGSEEGKVQISAVIKNLLRPRSLDIVERFQAKLQQWYKESYAHVKMFDSDRLGWSMEDVTIAIRGRTMEEVNATQRVVFPMERSIEHDHEADKSELFVKAVQSCQSKVCYHSYVKQNLPAFDTPLKFHTTLVTAGAGYGKTTFSRRLCFLWAKKRLENVKLMISIPFGRALAMLSKSTLPGLIENSPISELASEEQLILFVVCAIARLVHDNDTSDMACLQMAIGVLVALKTNSLAPGEVVLCIDGLDEVPPEIRRKWLSFLHSSNPGFDHSNTSENVNLVLTSRPEGVEPDFAVCDRFEIDPLAFLDKVKFVTQFCNIYSQNPLAQATANDGRSLLRRLEELTTTGPLANLCSVPMLLLMVCVLEAEACSTADSSLGVKYSPLVDLFDKFCKWQFHHFMAKSLITKPFPSWSEQNDMLALQRFAFDILFFGPDVYLGPEGRFVKLASSIGFVSVEKIGNGQSCIAFQHKLFMEYFASLYISNTLEEEGAESQRIQEIVDRSDESQFKKMSLIIRFLLDSKPKLCLRLLKITRKLLLQNAQVSNEGDYRECPDQFDAVEWFETELRQRYMSEYAYLGMFPNDPHAWKMEDVFINLRERKDPYSCGNVMEPTNFIRTIRLCKSTWIYPEEGNARRRGGPDDLRFNVNIISAGHGYGKTSLARRLCYLWAQKRFDNIKFLVSILFDRSLIKTMESTSHGLVDGVSQDNLTAEERLILLIVWAAVKTIPGNGLSNSACMHVALGVLLAVKLGRLKPEHMVICFKGFEEHIDSERRHWLPFLNYSRLMAKNDLEGFSFSSTDQQELLTLSRRAQLIVLAPESRDPDLQDDAARYFRILPLTKEQTARFALHFCKVYSRKQILNEAERSQLSSKLLHLINSLAANNIIVANPMLLQMLCAVFVTGCFGDATISSIGNITLFQLFDMYCRWQFSLLFAVDLRQTPLATWRRHPCVMALQRFACECVFSSYYFPEQYFHLTKQQEDTFTSVSSSMGFLNIVPICKHGGVDVAFQHQLFLEFFASCDIATELIGGTVKHFADYVECGFGPFCDTGVFARFVLDNLTCSGCLAFRKHYETICSQPGPIVPTSFALEILRVVARCVSKAANPNRASVELTGNQHLDAKYERLTGDSKQLVDFIARQNWAFNAIWATRFDELSWDIHWPANGLPRICHEYPFLFVECENPNGAFNFLQEAARAGLQVANFYLGVHCSWKTLEDAVDQAETVKLNGNINLMTLYDYRSSSLVFEENGPKLVYHSR